MSKKTATMIARDPQKEESPKTTRNSPEIINNAAAMLPEEMWQEIIQYLEYRDFLNLKIASKHLNPIATRVAKRKYEWYELCRKKVPERYWREILENAQHPVNDRINCDNFHDEKEFATIWRFLYSTWAGWSTMIDKEPDVQELAFNARDEANTLDISVDGYIIAVHHHHEYVIHFYNILQLTAGPIYSIPCPIFYRHNTVSRKGTQLTATLVGLTLDGAPMNGELMDGPPMDGTTTIQKWNVESKELIYSKNMSHHVQDAFVCESFGYLCTITMHSERERGSSKVEIRREASNGNSRYIRLPFTGDEFVTAVKAHGDTLMLLTIHLDEYPIKLYKISIRECQLKKTHETSITNRGFGDFFLFHPCVVACVYYYEHQHEYENTQLGFSVSGRVWKSYNTTRDLNLEAPIITNAVLYEGGVLALLMWSGNVQLIYVDDPDDLDSKLETLPSKIVTLNWNNIFAIPWDDGSLVSVMAYARMCFTKYNSKIYLIVAVPEGAIILEF